MIGKSEGKCKIASLNKTPNSIFLLEPRLISSMRSIKKNKLQEKTKIIKKENKFSLSKYLKKIIFLNMQQFFWFYKK